MCVLSSLDVVIFGTLSVGSACLWMGDKDGVRRRERAIEVGKKKEREEMLQESVTSDSRVLRNEDPNAR